MNSPRTLLPFVLAGLAALTLVPVLHAAPSAADLERLDKDLTPVGAERAGNKDGSIPAWTGGLTSAPAGFDPKTGYPDPYAADKPLFAITAQNADQYKDKLSLGQIALLKKYPTLKFNVYPTRRSAAYPDKVYKDAKAFAASTKLSPSGNTVSGSGSSAVPFPLARTGQEVLLNHTFRWIGGGVEAVQDQVIVTAGGTTYRNRVKNGFYRDAQGYVEGSKKGNLMALLTVFQSPATLEGTIYLSLEPLNMDEQDRITWIYNAGQRRVRRAPDVAYDFVAEGSEGLRYSDNVDGWNGKFDRYDIKLIGKKEAYIPYNSYKLADKKLKYADMHKPGHLNPELLRYELHRVWVVEATLKPGQRHLISKRTFYVDEDTWQVAVADMYDSRNELWRVLEGHPIQYYDVQVPWYNDFAIYDLHSGAYISNGLQNEVGAPWKFGVKAQASDLNGDALRRMGTK